MFSTWNRPGRLGVLSLGLVLYLTVGLLGTRRKTALDAASPTGSDVGTVKTVVGYSVEYAAREELRGGLECEGAVESSGSSGWAYDPKLDAHVLSAFLDVRQDPHRYVRIVGLLPPNSSFYCQISYRSREGLASVTHRASVRAIWAAEWGDSCTRHRPSLITCPAPLQKNGATPVFVSFVDETCSGSNVTLRIIQPRRGSRRQDFVVCVKPLHLSNYNDASLREWLELNLLLGADKILIYLRDPVPPVLEVLRPYVRRKLVETASFAPPEGFRDCSDLVWWKRKLEVIAYNDCFYRNLYSAEFVLPLDVDELVVPKMADTWQETFRAHFGDDSDSDKYASYGVRNVYFFSKYPDGLAELVSDASNASNASDASVFARTRRSFRYSPVTDSIKSFVRVSSTLTVFNHYTFHVLNQARRQYLFPETVVQLNHYRNDCDPQLIDGCQQFLQNSTEDRSLERFRDKIPNLSRGF